MPVDIGIGLLPDRILGKALWGLSKKLRGMHTTSYELGSEYHPHLTVYQGTFKSEDDVRKAIRAVPGIHKKARDASMSPEKFRVSHGFVMLDCEVLPSIRDLHYAVVDGVQEVRDKEAPTIWGRKGIKFPPKMEEAIGEYGFPFSKELYDPHFTIGTVTDENFDNHLIEVRLGEEAAHLFGKISYPHRMVLYDIGVHGSCMNPRDI